VSKTYQSSHTFRGGDAFRLFLEAIEWITNMGRGDINIVDIKYIPWDNDYGDEMTLYYKWNKDDSD
jgi:hypothetical protein